jgi:hypothetical protein
MEYKIVEASNTDRLVYEVNLAIKDGWKPQGGVSTAKDESFISLFQAMVK